MIKLIERELIQDGERITGVSAYRWKESRWEYAGVWYMPQEEWLKLRGCIEVGLEDNPLNYLSFSYHESQRPRDEFKRGDPGHPDNDMGM